MWNWTLDKISILFPRTVSVVQFTTLEWGQRWASGDREPSPRKPAGAFPGWLLSWDCSSQSHKWDRTSTSRPQSSPSGSGTKTHWTSNLKATLGFVSGVGVYAPAPPGAQKAHPWALMETWMRTDTATVHRQYRRKSSSDLTTTSHCVTT